jgi:hypothetical protein
MIKKLTFTILFLVAASISFAQQNKIPFEKYGVPEGLPEETVYSQIQDDKGFIWFGTQNGLVKYDGYHFKVYKLTADTTGLQVKYVDLGGLLKSRDGKIWIGGITEEGQITSFDPLTEKFRNFKKADTASTIGLRSRNIVLFEDEASNIWFKSFSVRFQQTTTCRLNPITGVIKQYPVGDINRTKSDLRNFGTIESSGNIWLLDDKKNLLRLNQQKDSFEIILPAGKDLMQTGNADTIMQLGKGSAGRLLLMGTHGLYIFDSKHQKIVKSYVHSESNVNSIPDSMSFS